VEKNLVKLDDEIDHILPELAGQKILVGFEQDGSPILKPRQRTITLRQLLTHSAGLGYTFMNEELAQYQKSRGKRVIQGSTVEERFGQPLLYEPGTAWNYSASLDWTGKLVERVAKKSLEDYLVENVWKPLGATGFTFWPDRERKGKGQLATLAERQLATGKLKPLSKFSLNEGVEDCLGGQGGYSNAESFMKLLHSLLANDEKVLQKQTVDMMFQGQLSPESKAVLNENMKDPAWAVGDFYPGEEYDWGFGGLLVTKAAASGPRQSGTLAWSGAANLFWVS
jgi:CubicO group peptidase (beta-lactamase class C family)